MNRRTEVNTSPNLDSATARTVVACLATAAECDGHMHMVEASSHEGAGRARAAELERRKAKIKFTDAAALRMAASAMDRQPA